MQYELSPIPPSMFDKNGDMRQASNKSALKNELQVNISDRMNESADVQLDAISLAFI